MIMNKIKSKIVYIVLLTLVTFQSSYGASFDCKKASTLVEQAICSDPMLSSLDEDLALSYKKALKNSSDNNILRTAQRSWIKSKRNPCKNIACLKQAYASRISELNKTNDNDYTAVKFFKDIETTYITTVDNISVDQKAAIISSGFLRSSKICDDKSGLGLDSWYVIERKNAFLKLGRCETGDNVDIHIYKHKNAGNIGLVVSIMGNHGDVQDFQFFSISKENRIGKKLTLEELNIYYLHEKKYLLLD